MSIKPIFRNRAASFIIKSPVVYPSKGRGRLESFLFDSKSKMIPTMITPYHWPDLDGIASMFTLKRLLEQKGYRDVEAVVAQTPQQEPAWVMKKLGISFPRYEDWILKKRGNEQLILVDVSDPKDLPAQFPLNQICAVIDHRSYSQTEQMPNALTWIECVGAAATLVGELCICQNMDFDKISAQLLYAAIMSNTIKGSTRNTTPRDRMVAEFLQSTGHLDESFVDEMFHKKSDLSQMSLQNRIDEDLSTKLQKIGPYMTAIAQLEIEGAEKLIQSRTDELKEALNYLKVQRGAEKIFLIAIDIFSMKTFFFFEDAEIKKVVASAFSLKDCKDYSFLEEVVTRKDLIGSSFPLII